MPSLMTFINRALVKAFGRLRESELCEDVSTATDGRHVIGWFFHDAPGPIEGATCFGRGLVSASRHLFRFLLEDVQNAFRVSDSRRVRGLKGDVAGVVFRSHLDDVAQIALLTSTEQ